MKIYVASSWRNVLQPAVVEVLRNSGHTVYDFRNPGPGNFGFSWAEVDPRWQEWSNDAFITALDHPAALRGFDSDMNALSVCDACVLVLPCGRSAHLEAGWAIGAGKPVCILLNGHQEPELMYKMALTVIPDDLDAVAKWANGIERTEKNLAANYAAALDYHLAMGGSEPE